MLVNGNGTCRKYVPESGATFENINIQPLQRLLERRSGLDKAFSMPEQDQIFRTCTCPFTVEHFLANVTRQAPVHSLIALSISKVKLYDVSIVTTPAYSGTEIGLRSLEAHRQQKAKSQAARRIRMKAKLLEGGDIKDLLVC